MKKIIASIFCFLFLVSNAQQVNKWLEDIDFYQKTLEEKHINLYHTLSKKEFNSEIENLKSKLPNLSDFQVIVELMRITQKIGGGKGDGHTSIPLWNRNLHKYPIKLFDFDGEIRVISIDNNFSDLLSYKLKSINGIAVHKIYKKVSKLTPFTENKQSFMDRTCNYLTISELLKALNVVENIEKTSFTFIDENDDEITILLNAMGGEELKKLEWATISIQHPSIIKSKDAAHKNLWFTSLNDSKTIYIKFGEYPSFEEMTAFSERVYHFIQKNKSEHLIIDFRNNYGGDFYKGLILANYLNLSNSVGWLSNVYVLTNRKTYSAAMVNAVQFKQLLNAKIVGEPSGGNPNGYQDLGQFTLPNSKIVVTYSKRLFHLQNAKVNGLQPDILITPKWDNYKKGYDEVLSWVLKRLNVF